MCSLNVLRFETDYDSNPNAISEADSLGDAVINPSHTESAVYLIANQLFFSCHSLIFEIETVNNPFSGNRFIFLKP